MQDDTYDNVRPYIRDGWLIAVRGQHLVDDLTRAVTGSPITHTGIAVWLDGRLFMADLNSGRNHLTALSCVDNFDVHAPPFGLDPDAIRAAVFDWLATPIDYGLLGFVGIGLRCLLARTLKLRLVLHWRKILVCSSGSVLVYEMAARAMKAVGLTPPAAWLEHDHMISPGELAAELPLLYQVRKGAKA